MIIVIQIIPYRINYLLSRIKFPTIKAFKYNDKGTLVSLSSFTALGSISNKFGKNPLTVQGKFAQFAYVSLYRMHQHALHGCIKIGLIILVDKLNHYLKPRLKLH